MSLIKIPLGTKCHSAELCTSCRNVLDTFFETEDFVDKIVHGSQHSLRQAVEQNCLICCIVWTTLQLGRRGELASRTLPSLCRAYEVYSDTRQDFLIKLEVVIEEHDACHQEVSFTHPPVRFRIMPLSDSGTAAPHLTIDSLGDKTSSPATLSLARSWYETCRDTHSRCDIPLNDKRGWKPTRLIYFGRDMADCRKLCSSPDPPAQYMTLSYRWGVQPGTMLLRRNFDDFHRDTPISILPQTFQDAITVARAFSVAYIWIDALCIIQDSDTDWELEAPTMRYVYSHSACNIAASAAADQHSGLFRTRHGESVLPGFFKSGTTSTNHGTDRFLIFDKGYWSRYLNCGALHSRGWVFQECLLAPRVVYFAKDQILWECLVGNKCEGFPLGIPYHQRTKDLSPLWDSLETDVDRQIYGTSKQMSYKIHTLWSNLVERYSSCDLTFSKDKLPALSGVAQVFASATGDNYAYGMWHSRIVEQLLWRAATPNPGRSLQQSKVPSWSWASLDGTIEMTPIPISWKSLVEIVEIKHTNMFAESSSQSSNPSLRLKGALSVLGESGTKDHSSIRLGSLRLGCDISPDYHHVHDDRSSHAVYFLPTLSAHPWYPAKRFTTQVVGLVLALQGQNTPVKFHRVGLFSTDRSHDIERLGLTITPEGLATLKRLEHHQEIEII